MKIDINTTKDLCRNIVDRVRVPPTHIAGICNGGIVAGGILSRYWDIPFIAIKNDQSRKSLVELTKVINDAHDPSILIVDDFCDTGFTMSSITNYLFMYSEPNSVTTAVLCARETTQDLVDVYGIIVEDNEYIESIREIV